MDSGFIYGIFLMLGMTMIAVAAVFAVATWLRNRDGGKVKTRALQGLVAGVFVFCFIIFPGIGWSLLQPILAPGFKVTVPQDYEGYVHIYYQDKKPRTKLGWDLNYHIDIPESANATVNISDNAFVDNLDFDFRYPDQTQVDWVYVGGSLSQVHEIYLIGDPPDEGASQKATPSPSSTPDPGYSD